MDAETNEVILALRYPDYHTWRDLEAAKKNGYKWPNGTPVSIADPEMQPFIHQFLRDLAEDTEKREAFMKRAGMYADDDE